MKKITAVILVLILNIGNLSAFAEDDSISPELKEMKESLEKSIPSKSLSECKETLVPLYDVEVMIFIKFIETNFQNKSAASSLVNIAIARFSEFKQTLNGHFAKLSPKYSTAENIKEYEKEYNEYVLCGGITESYIQLAKEHMVRHIKNNVSQKKTSILLEKFKAINTKLRDLNLEIAELFAFFVTFKNKLPGFLKDCQSS